MAINEEDPEKMRLQPVGRDKQGLMYWLQLDQEQNIRLYTEEQDDLDGSTWKCIVRYFFSGGYTSQAAITSIVIVSLLSLL